MLNKVIRSYDEVESSILDAVSLIADPVVQTLSPKGGNVLYNEGGRSVVSNDGISIARSIKVDDNFKNSIINIIRESSLRTNQEAGDGTTTSILLTSVLVREGLKLRRDGINQMEIVNQLRLLAPKIEHELDRQMIEVKSDEDIENIARISANNDDHIARLVLLTVKVAGTDGMVFIEQNSREGDEIVSDIGFQIKAGMLRPELRNGHGFTAHYKDVPVLVTDKRLYYKEEAETILRTVYQAGHKEVVIVARDFIGECLNMFVSNHTNGSFKILLIKDPSATDDNYESLEDLASYLDCPVVTEKQGALVNDLTIEQFGFASKVFADPQKTIISKDGNGTNANLSLRLTALRTEQEKKPNDEVLKSRIASLTSGMVTIKVSASTETELQEKIFRFEDSVNAARSALKHGYLPGGGVALFNARNIDGYSPEYRMLVKRFCEASIRQIAKNCGKDGDNVIETIENLHEDLSENKIGYDASSNSYLNMIDIGVIDPFQVVKLAVENSISAACNILSVNYYIINEQPKETEESNK